MFKEGGFAMKTFTIADIQKILKERYRTSVSQRTLNNWFFDMISVDMDSKASIYDVYDVAFILDKHKITQFRKDYLPETLTKSNTDEKHKDAISKFVDHHFDEVKNAKILYFLLDKSGYAFNDAKLKDDLRNVAIRNDQKLFNSKSDKEQDQISVSVARVYSTDRTSYIRKVRSDKKK